MAAGDITVTVTVVGTDTRSTAVNFSPTAKTYSSIADVYRRDGLITSTTVATLLTIGAAAGATLAALNFLAIKNEDPTDSVMIGFVDTGVKAAYVKLDPGETLILGSDQLEANATGGAFSAFTAFDTITVDAVANTPRISVIAF